LKKKANIEDLHESNSTKVESSIINQTLEQKANTQDLE